MTAASAAATSCSFCSIILRDSSAGSRKAVAVRRQKGATTQVGQSNFDFWNRCTKIQSSAAALKYGSCLGQRTRKISTKVTAEGGEGEEPSEAVSERWSLDEFDQQLKVFESREKSASRQTPSPGEEPRDEISERWSLDELDQQLKVFESHEEFASRQIPIPRQTLGDPDNQRTGEWSKLQWPLLTNEFFVYTAILLVLLTVINNILYKIFLGPPGVDRNVPFKTSVPERPRYRVTTLQEESDAREARDATKAQQKALATQTREAPILSE